MAQEHQRLLKKVKGKTKVKFNYQNMKIINSIIYQIGKKQVRIKMYCMIVSHTT